MDISGKTNEKEWKQIRTSKREWSGFGMKQYM